MGARYEVRSDVALITLDNPPVNSLGLQTRRELAAGIGRAVADAAVVAIVVAGAGRAYSGGADIKEFGLPAAVAEPNLLSLIGLFEDCTKPVVAAVHGVCMGGGLELALGAHYRVAAPGASVAMPEVKIGLIPGAGGTQRLPRVLGVETALDFIVGGEPVRSEVLAALPGQRLFDRIVEGDLPAGACAYARQVAAARRPGDALPRVRDLKATHPDPDAYFGRARSRVAAMSKHYPAPLKCVDAVEASVELGFDEGMARERAAFFALMSTPQCKALRHAFFSVRAAARVPDLSGDTPLRPVARVAVIGAGTMGSGIATCFLDAGIPVTLLEARQDSLDRGTATLRSHYEARLGKGKLDQDGFEARMALLGPTLNYADLAQADLVIEAVFEDLAVKEQVFRTLDEVMKPGAILASNTSTLDIDRIASFTRRPQDVVGTHFFSPAHAMKLLEVVRGARTAPDVLATVLALAGKIGKTAVVARVCDGFIGNRMIEQYLRQAGFLLDEGATPAQVDGAVERWGMAMGPFRTSDLAGNDIGWAIRKRRRVEQPRLRYSALADRLCERGRYGQKTGAGWYDYRAGGRDAIPSAAVDEMIAAHRAEIGVAPRAIGDDEIVHRLVYSLVNEGARILQEGVASRAGDVDVVYLTGYGFPRHRGGPMCYADQQGLFNVVQAMKTFAANPLDDASFWQPAPLLARLAAEGGAFT